MPGKWTIEGCSETFVSDPQLFQSLRGIIDVGRRSGRGNGRFLVLGSASIDLLKQSSESLAGRIRYVELGSLDVGEIHNSAWSYTVVPNDSHWHAKLMRFPFPNCVRN